MDSHITYPNLTLTLLTLLATNPMDFFIRLTDSAAVRHLGLMSLETRRVRGDLIEVFKFLNRSYTVDADIFFEYDKGNRRGHSKKLFKRRSRLDVRKYVFGNRVTDKWNNLPQCCINCKTLNNFKSHIHKVLKPKTE